MRISSWSSDVCASDLEERRSEDARAEAVSRLRRSLLTSGQIRRPGRFTMISEDRLAQIPLRHGVFLAPFHAMDENPSACLERDLELMQWLDRLGLPEAWIGEHHSAGWEIISSPDLFIAVAAERPTSIPLGPGGHSPIR